MYIYVYFKTICNTSYSILFLLKWQSSVILISFQFFEKRCYFSKRTEIQVEGHFRYRCFFNRRNKLEEFLAWALGLGQLLAVFRIWVTQQMSISESFGSFKTPIETWKTLRWGDFSQFSTNITGKLQYHVVALNEAASYEALAKLLL